MRIRVCSYFCANVFTVSSICRVVAPHMLPATFSHPRKGATYVHPPSITDHCTLHTSHTQRGVYVEHVLTEAAPNQQSLCTMYEPRRNSHVHNPQTSRGCTRINSQRIRLQCNSHHTTIHYFFFLLLIFRCKNLIHGFITFSPFWASLTVVESYTEVSIIR